MAAVEAISRDDDGNRLLHVKADLAEHALMPSARALMMMTALSEHGQLVRSVPPQESVEGFQGPTIEAWLVTTHDEQQVHDTAGAITDIVSAEVTAVELAPAGAGDDPAAADPATQAAAADPATQAAAADPATQAAAAEAARGQARRIARGRGSQPLRPHRAGRL